MIMDTMSPIIRQAETTVIALAPSECSLEPAEGHHYILPQLSGRNLTHKVEFMHTIKDRAGGHRQSAE